MSVCLFFSISIKLIRNPITNRQLVAAENLTAQKTNILGQALIIRGEWCEVNDVEGEVGLAGIVVFMEFKGYVEPAIIGA